MSRSDNNAREWKGIASHGPGRESDAGVRETGRLAVMLG